MSVHDWLLVAASVCFIASYVIVHLGRMGEISYDAVVFVGFPFYLGLLILLVVI